MAYNEQLAAKVRAALKKQKTEEKKMFGGIAFMLNGKMCMGVDKNDLMIRCTPEMTDDLLKEKGARLFDLSGKPMKGWLLVSEQGYEPENNFNKWVKVALDSNKDVKSSAKKPGKGK